MKDRGDIIVVLFESFKISEIWFRYILRHLKDIDEIPGGNGFDYLPDGSRYIFIDRKPL